MRSRRRVLQQWWASHTMAPIGWRLGLAAPRRADESLGRVWISSSSVSGIGCRTSSETPTVYRLRKGAAVALKHYIGRALIQAVRGARPRVREGSWHCTPHLWQVPSQSPWSSPPDDLRIRRERLAERPNEGRRRRRRRRECGQPHDRRASRGRRVHLREHRRAGALELEVRRQDSDRKEVDTRAWCWRTSRDWPSGDRGKP